MIPANFNFTAKELYIHFIPSEDLFSAKPNITFDEFSASDLHKNFANHVVKFFWIGG